jgi:hypothetical protein
MQLRALCVNIFARGALQSVILFNRAPPAALLWCMVSRPGRKGLLQ